MPENTNKKKIRKRKGGENDTNDTTSKRSKEDPAASTINMNSNTNNASEHTGEPNEQSDSIPERPIRSMFDPQNDPQTPNPAMETEDTGNDTEDSEKTIKEDEDLDTTEEITMVDEGEEEEDLAMEEEQAIEEARRMEEEEDLQEEEEESDLADYKETKPESRRRARISFSRGEGRNEGIEGEAPLARPEEIPNLTFPEREDVSEEVMNAALALNTLYEQGRIKTKEQRLNEARIIQGKLKVLKIRIPVDTAEEDDLLDEYPEIISNSGRMLYEEERESPKGSEEQKYRWETRRDRYKELFYERTFLENSSSEFESFTESEVSRDSIKSEDKPPTWQEAGPNECTIPGLTFTGIERQGKRKWESTPQDEQMQGITAMEIDEELKKQRREREERAIEIDRREKERQNKEYEERVKVRQNKEYEERAKQGKITPEKRRMVDLPTYQEARNHNKEWLASGIRKIPEIKIERKQFKCVEKTQREIAIIEAELKEEKQLKEAEEQEEKQLKEAEEEEEKQLKEAKDKEKKDKQRTLASNSVQIAGENTPTPRSSPRSSVESDETRTYQYGQEMSGQIIEVEIHSDPHDTLPGVHTCRERYGEGATEQPRIRTIKELQEENRINRDQLIWLEAKRQNEEETLRKLCQDPDSSSRSGSDESGRRKSATGRGVVKEYIVDRDGNEEIQPGERLKEEKGTKREIGREIKRQGNVKEPQILVPSITGDLTIDARHKVIYKGYLQGEQGVEIEVTQPEQVTPGGTVTATKTKIKKEKKKTSNVSDKVKDKKLSIMDEAGKVVGRMFRTGCSGQASKNYPDTCRPAGERRNTDNEPPPPNVDIRNIPELNMTENLQGPVDSFAPIRKERSQELMMPKEMQERRTTTPAMVEGRGWHDDSPASTFTNYDETDRETYKKPPAEVKKSSSSRSTYEDMSGAESQSDMRKREEGIKSTKQGNAEARINRPERPPTPRYGDEVINKKPIPFPIPEQKKRSNPHPNDLLSAIVIYRPGGETGKRG